MTESNFRGSSTSHCKCWEVPPGAIAMARFAGMESRLLAVLDPNRKRGGPSPVGTLAAILLMISTIAPFAALRVRAQATAPVLPATQPATNLISYMGRVLSADGIAVAGADIFVQTERYREFDRTRSGADGRFTAIGRDPLDSSAGRTVTVRAANVGVGSARLTKGEDNVVQLEPSTSVRVTLLNSENRPVPGVRIHPSVSIAFGASRAKFGWIEYPADWFDGAELITNASGECVIPMLPRQSQTQFEINDLRYAQPSNAERIQTGAGPESQPATFHLKRAGEITGTVTSATTGKPISGIHLIAIASQRGNAVSHGAAGDVVSSEQGEYRIRQVEAGTYTVRLLETTDLTATFRKAVRVVEGQTTGDQDFALVKGTVVTGRVLEADTGRSVPEVELLSIEPETREFPSHAKTDAAGRYTMRVPPGQMRLSISSPPPDGYARIARDTLNFTAVDGQDITLDIKFSPRPGNPVSGRVLDPHGKPIPGALVTEEEASDVQIAGFSLATNSVKSDEHGDFRFRAIMPGAHLSARLGEMGTVEPVAVEGGEKNVTLPMAASFSTMLVGMVLDDKGKPIENARIGLSISRGIMTLGGGAPDALTDANGKFRIPNLGPDSKYSLRIDADGFGTIRMEVPFKPGEAICQLGEIKLSK